MECVNWIYLKIFFVKYFLLDLVNKISDCSVFFEFSGEICEIFVFFIDLVGFIFLIECIIFVEFIVLMNVYFDILMEIVFKYGGIIDKYVGDVFYLIFGVLIFLDDYVECVVCCVIEMNERVEDFKNK